MRWLIDSVKERECLNPPRPRYDFVWDPAPVLAKLGTLFPYDSLPLETITKKMVLLLALATGQRAQTLALFKLSQISMGDKLTIRVPDRVKTSAPGRPQPFFSFSPFIDSENLCVYGIVKHYLTITQDLRNSSGDSFFISFVRPHRAVGQQTISRWLRLSLSDCGVKSDLLSSHSTRHAATSLAARKGVPLDLIKRAAGWSGSSQVFARFYNRPIIDPEEFSSAVLRAWKMSRISIRATVRTKIAITNALIFFKDLIAYIILLSIMSQLPLSIFSLSNCKSEKEHLISNHTRHLFNIKSHTNVSS